MKTNIVLSLILFGLSEAFLPTKTGRSGSIALLAVFDGKPSLPDWVPSDFSGFQDALSAGQENLMGGTVGERGEAYVAAQFGLILCVLIGGVPVIGEPVRFLLGPSLLIGGALVMVTCINEMGSSMTPWPVPSSKNDKLIDTGVFGYVRHPTYAGVLAACLGLAIVTESANRLILTALLWYALDVKSQFEESKLAERFPDDYKTYQNKVKGKFVPHIVLDKLPWTQ